MATQIFVYVHPEKLGKLSSLTCAYFSDGLVQPPTSQKNPNDWKTGWKNDFPKDFWSWKILVEKFQPLCIYIYIYLEPHDLYFWRSIPQNKAFSNQNKGHLGSRCIYIYMYSYRWWFQRFLGKPQKPLGLHDSRVEDMILFVKWLGKTTNYLGNLQRPNRRLVTPNGSLVRESPPKMALNQVKDL